jgi:hypothetical protein
MRSPSRIAVLFLSLAFVLAPLATLATGCVKKTLTDGQIEGTRRGAVSIDTVADYEMARTATHAGLAQFEGMHTLDPDNVDALYLLVKSWTGYGFAFIEDDLEAAQDAGDDGTADYQRKRARTAFDRAVFYGLQMIGQKAEGFDQAKKSEPTLAKWLKDHFTEREDAHSLYWTGNAWASRVDLMKGDDLEGGGFIAELYIGIAMLERALTLDPSLEHYGPVWALGLYHARTNIAELDQAKQMLDTALAKTQGRALLVPFFYATKYACMKGDAALYQDMLNRVLLAQDPDPELRLPNAIAKRRAKRWLSKKRAKEECGIELPGTAAAK